MRSSATWNTFGERAIYGAVKRRGPQHKLGRAAVDYHGSLADDSKTDVGDGRSHFLLEPGKSDARARQNAVQSLQFKTLTTKKSNKSG